MVKTMAEARMSAEADAVCGAGYGERSEERLNRRNGYRERDWDTRAGTVELAMPKLRTGCDRSDASWCRLAAVSDPLPQSRPSRG